MAKNEGSAVEGIGRLAIPFDGRNLENTAAGKKRGRGRDKWMETGRINKGRWVLFLVLPLIVLASLSLWYLRNFYRAESVRMTRVEPVNNVYDLTGIDFAAGFALLQGDLEYIPGVLTPEEFDSQKDEAVSGPCRGLTSATSRVVIRTADDGVYTVTGSSIDYAHKAYFNGELRFQAGVPAENAEDFVPGYVWMEVEIRPENGVIELVQQGADFVHRKGGVHGNLYIGKPEIMQRFTALTAFTEAIQAGLFAALFFVHLLMFLVQQNYRPSLYLSLLCLAWAVLNGLTGSRVFYALFPALPWQAAYRLAQLALPAVFILIVLLAREIFPGIPQRWFVRTSAGMAAVFSAVFLIADTALLPWALLCYNGACAAAGLYLCARFLMKLPGMARAGKLRTEHVISLLGFTLFLFAAVYDQLCGTNAPLSPDLAVTDAAMMIFSFFQTTAIFYGAMRETSEARERVRQAESEREILSEMSRLKSSFYTDMSHEMKTPLTVIAINAQFAAQNIRAGTVDEETVTDLNIISDEAVRLAQMVTSLVGIGRMQGAGRGPLPLAQLLTGTARIYQSLFTRKGNTLTVEAEQDLPAVEGDADQIIQVLINLLSNANRHTTGGLVVIRAEVQKRRSPSDSQDAKVMVSVMDNGEGIAPELLPHVFERFCHGEKGGSGLGLPICKTIIEGHGGDIGVESEDGRGTRVWFTLPVMEEIKGE